MTRKRAPRKVERVVLKGNWNPERKKLMQSVQGGEGRCRKSEVTCGLHTRLKAGTQRGRSRTPTSYGASG